MDFSPKTFFCIVFILQCNCFRVICLQALYLIQVFCRRQRLKYSNLILWQQYDQVLYTSIYLYFQELYLPCCIVLKIWKNFERLETQFSKLCVCTRNSADLVRPFLLTIIALPPRGLYWAKVGFQVILYLHSRSFWFTYRS